MVAAAKLRKAQDAAEASRPYSDRMGAVIANLANSMAGKGDAPQLLVGNGKSDTVLLIVATADRGLCGGFFVFGMNLEAYFADGPDVYKGIYNQDSRAWDIVAMPDVMPSADVLAINGANQLVWDQWLQDHYLSLLDTKNGTVKPHNMRWFASMVSDVKRLLLQGGIFAYPSANRKGYESGHLRLVYEAIPMSFLIRAMGGASTDGTQSLLAAPVTDLHQKTPVFIGNADKIAAIEAAKRAD